jgi:hypothetical protein
MGEAFPELHSKKEFVKEIIEMEESLFGRTLDNGEKRFKKLAADAKARPARRERWEGSGKARGSDAGRRAGRRAALRAGGSGQDSWARADSSPCASRPPGGERVPF